MVRLGGLPLGIPAVLGALWLGALAAVPSGAGPEGGRRRSRQAGQRRAQQFEARLAETLDPATLLELAVRYPADLLGAGTAALLVREPQSGVLIVREVVGLPRTLLGTSLPDEIFPPFPPRPNASERRRPWRPRTLAPDSVPALAPFAPVIGVPLMRGSGRIGALLLGPRSEAAAYTPSDFLLLAHLATQVTGAVERAEIGSRYNRRIQELNTLDHLGQALSTTLDMEAICRTTYDHLHAALEFDSFFIGHWNHIRDEMIYLLAMDEGAPFYISPSQGQGGLVGWIFEHRQPLLVPDLVTEHDQYQPDPFGSARRSRSWLGVPMIADDRLIGVLSVQSYQPNLYTAEHVQFLSIVANLTARALENTRLFQERERRIAELGILNEISRQISGSLRVDDLLETIHSQVGRVIDTTNFYIALYDATDDEVEFRCYYERGESRPLLRRPMANGLTEWIIRQREPLELSGDVAAQVRNWGLDVVGEVPRSYLGVPLLVGDRVIGAMAVQDYERDDAYDQDHLRLFATVAAQAGVVIENATLYERTDTALAQRVAQLSSIEEIDRQINASLDLKQIIHLVVERAMAATTARAGILALYDPERQILRILADVGYPPAIVARYQTRPLRVGQGIVGRAIRSNETQLVVNVGTDPDYITVLPEVRAQLAVLIRREGQILGTISLESTDPDHFSPDAVDFVEHLAEHAALAIDNAARYEREREQNRAQTRRAAELAAILRVGNSLRTDLPLADVLQQVAESVTTSLGFRVAVLSLVEEDGGATPVVRVAAAGLTDEAWSQLKGGRRSLQQIERLLQPTHQLSQSYYIRRGASLLGDTLYYRPNLPEDVEPGQWHPDDMFIVPLIGKGGRLIGILSVDEPLDRRVPGQATAETMEIFANVAALAIENAARYELEREQTRALARRAGELAAILQVGNSMRADRPLDQILQQVVEGVTGSLGFRSVVLSLVAEGGGTRATIERVAAVGVPPAAWEQLKALRRTLDELEPFMQPHFQVSQSYFIPHSEGLTEQVAYYRPDLPEDGAPGTWHPDDFLLVPLLGRRGRLVGLLSVDDPLDGLVPTKTTVETLEIFANNAALAIENARLFEGQNRRLTELSTLQELGLALTTTLDLEEVMEAVVRAVLRLLDIDASSVLLWEEGREDQFRAMRGFHEGDTVQVRADDLPAPRHRGISYEVRATATPVVIPDAATDPRVSPAALTVGFRSILGVPLRLGDRVLGVLYANSIVPRPFAEHAVNLLQIFANQAAVALENARLFAEQHHRLQEVSMLQRVGLALNANLDLDALLDEVVRAAVHLLGVQASGILLIEGGEFGGQETRYRSMRGYWEDGRLVAVPDYQAPRVGGLADTIRLSATPLVVEDTETDERVGPVTRGWGIRALMGVPLRVGTRVLGVLYANSTTPRLFAPHEVNLLQIFANQVTIAIENARLFEERGRRLKEISTLQQLGLSLTATLDLEAVLAEVAQATLRLLSVTSSRVLLIGEGHEQESRAVHGTWQEGKAVAVADTRPSRPSGLTHLVRVSATPVVIPDTAVDARVPPTLRGEGVRALIGVPLRLGERVLGVLYAHSDTPRVFASHEIDLLQIFANQAAVAIENARLFEERRAVETRLAAENMRMARELVTARATQQRLLPTMPRIAGRLHCHGVCLPAMEVGGDYFDVLPLPDGRVALALGDVTGKGTAAVMITSMIKTALLSQVAIDPAPAAVFNALYMLAREFLHDRLMTFFYGLWDPAAETLFYFNAGHLFPYVRRVNGQFDTLEQSGLPLGAVMGVEQDLGWMPMHEGDSFVCVSDGIVEAEDANGKMFGFNRLEDLLRASATGNPETLVTDLVDEVWRYAGGPPDDDVTVLVVQVLPADTEPVRPPPTLVVSPPPPLVAE